jgi:hypothetical protein
MAKRRRKGQPGVCLGCSREVSVTAYCDHCAPDLSTYARFGTAAKAGRFAGAVEKQDQFDRRIARSEHE